MALRVNGERIDDSIIQKEVQRLRPDYERIFADVDPQRREAQLLEWSKENVVERTILRQDAAKNSAPIPPADTDAALAALKEDCDLQELCRANEVQDDRGLRDRVELGLKAERKLIELCRDLPEPSPAEIADYYEQHKPEFATGEAVRAAHIVRYVNGQTDEQTALAMMTRVRDEIRRGMPFELAVDKCSDCMDAAGDLGYVVHDQLVEEFEDVVFSLAVGQVSDVFRTRFGYHIAKAYDRRPAQIPPLKHMQKKVVAALTQQMREKVVDDYLDQLRARAVVEEIQE